jgi:hydrophobe/amphiphile efflux-1 (HAE1) family protein
MSLSTFSIKRPVFTIVINILLILFGAIGYTYLGVREYPSIDPAIITVRTNYSGANSDIIESQITEPLEKSINSIDGIRTISSSSNQGSSNITIEFNLDKNLEEAANDVRDKVSQAMRNLPLDIDAPPVVSKADADSDPIIILTVRSTTRNILDLSDYAENAIAQRLQTLPGVSGVNIYGQKKYAMRLWIDPLKLSSYNLSVSDVKNALTRENIELPSGKVTGSNTELGIKTMGNLANAEQFNNLIIKADGNKVVHFSDIGTATLGPENLETKMEESGTLPMLGLAIIPQPGTNYIQIANDFYKRLDQLQKELPEDILLEVSVDNTLFIKQSVTEVAETILIALILVIVIIYFFFRDWSIAFRPLVDIPVSLIATFFLMYLFGFSINVLTLLAIVLATGLVVDDGIVVTENIFKKVEEGMSPFEAAIKGSNEILIPVLSISITLAAVFLPVIFLEGFVGQLFREFGVVIASAVLISAFVSLTLTPMLNAYLMKGGKHKKTKFYNFTEPFFVSLNKGYSHNLAQFLKRKWLSYPIIAACLGMSAFFFIILKKETAPYDDRSSLRVNISTPEGSSYEFTERLMQELSNVVNDSVSEKKINLVITSPGYGSASINSGRMIMALKQPTEREASQKEIASRLTKISRNFPDAKILVTEQPTIAVNKRGGLPVQYIIKAPNFKQLEEKVPLFMDEVATDPTFSVADVNLKFNKPELNISIDREKAQSLNVSILDIAQTLQMSLSGQRFSYFMMNGKQYQVIAQFEQEYRASPLDLSSMFVKNNKDELIQLDNLVTITEHSTPPQLYRTNRYLSATVSAGLAPGKSIEDGINAMDAIAKRTLDDSFSTDLSGEARDYVESGSNTAFAFILALLLIYLILAAQFESFKDPLIILITVPLALSGALASLWLFGQTWNIFSQIGSIMLIGLVTKNGILIVEFANQLKEEGKPKLQAILEASESRLRPILMTSLTIILGAMPIAVAMGAAAKSRMGMGIVIVGGTTFSLILTLFVIPGIYAMWSKETKKKVKEDFSSTNHVEIETLKTEKLTVN